MLKCLQISVGKPESKMLKQGFTTLGYMQLETFVVTESDKISYDNLRQFGTEMQCFRGFPLFSFIRK